MSSFLDPYHSLSMPTETSPHKGSVLLPRYVFYILIVLLVLLVVLTIAIPLLVHFGHKCPSNGSTPTNSTPSAASMRLPRAVLPVKYWLSIKTYLPSPSVKYEPYQNFTFDGKVIIMVQCIENGTRNLTLNIDELKLKKSTVRVNEVHEDGTNDRRVALREKNAIKHDQSRSQTVFFLNEPLLSGKQYKIEMEFTGQLSDSLTGFYRSSYMENGVKKWLAVTQFQPTSARKAFPCFDEPDMKAEFMISLTYPASLSALSNAMEKDEKTLPDGWKMTDYKSSPKMSTYLVAMIICDFGYKESHTRRGTRFRVWTKKSMTELGTFASQVGPRLLDYYETYFRIPFPLEKQDMVAIPDFDAGAMENWGLITYREFFLIYSPISTSARFKLETIKVIAHELVHQWFGNLVTMEWWNDLWLNEGFATYLQTQGIPYATDPSLHASTISAVKSVQTALDDDQYSSTHPLQVTVTDPNEIIQIFDRITYDKGSWMVRMVEFVAGQDVFRDSLGDYLKMNLYSMYTMNELWTVLTNRLKTTNSGWGGKPLNVSEFMHCWITREGYPMLTITRDYDKNTASVSQEKFVIETLAGSGKYPLSEKCKGGWYVPLWYLVQDQMHRKQFAWLEPSKPLSLATVAADQWMVANPDIMTFCRVRYDQQNWQLLTNQLRNDHSPLTSETRSQLLDDAFSLAKAGKVTYSIAFNLTKYLARETEFLPWYTALNKLSEIYDKLRGHESHPSFKNYYGDLIRPVFTRMGPEQRESDPNNVAEHMLRESVWKESCKLDEPKCVQDTKAMFAQFKIDCVNQKASSQCNRVSANLREVTYCMGTKYGNKEDWEFLWEKYKSEDLTVESSAILQGLGCTKDEKILMRLLREAYEGETIKTSEAGVVFGKMVAKNPLAKEMYFNYVTDNWDDIIKKFDGSSSFTMIVQGLGEVVKSREDLRKLKNFIDENKDNLGTSSNAFLAVLAECRAKMLWIETYIDTIVDWLDKYGNSGSLF